jgi:hypothetical protein
MHMRDSRGVIVASPRIRRAAMALMAAGLLCVAGSAVAAPPGTGSAARPDRPGKPDRPDRPDRPSPPGRPDSPAPNPITPAPSRPSNPATPINPIAGSPGGGAPAGTGTTPARGGAAGSAGGGTATRTTTLRPVPRGVRTSGLTAGRGEVRVRYFADLGHVASASEHMAVIPALLARLASDSPGTIVLRPLVITGAPDSTEAACALIAAGASNRAWHAAHHLAAARVTRDGNWVTPSVLRGVARKVSGLTPKRFVRASASRSCFPKLNRFRKEAAAAGVGSSPTYVITGERGTVRMAAPGSVERVIEAMASVG